MYGSQLRNNLFLFGDGVLDLGAGTRSVSTREVLDAKKEFEMQQAVAPSDPQQLKRHWCDEARSAFAKELNCDPKDIACAANDMDALTMALRQLVHWDYTRMITTSEKYRDIHLRVVYEQDKLTIDTGCRTIVNPTSQSFKAEFTAALRRFGWYPTCVVVPAEDVDCSWIIEQTRKFPAVTTIVVETRGLGHDKIDLSEVDPDMFVVEAGPCFYSGDSCSALYVSKKTQEKFYRPFSENSWAVKFGADSMWGVKLEDSDWLETTSLVVLCAAANFRNSVLGGSDAVIQYQTDLAKQAADYLVEEWLVNERGSVTNATFSVECPFQPAKELAPKFMKYVKSRLLRKHKIVVSMVQLDATIVFQFRAKAFLELEDFKVVKSAVIDTIRVWMKKCKRARLGTMPEPS